MAGPNFLSLFYLSRLVSTRVVMCDTRPLLSLLYVRICFSSKVFLRDAEQRDAWISTQEAFLSNEDLGVSMPAPMVAWSKSN